MPSSTSLDFNSISIDPISSTSPTRRTLLTVSTSGHQRLAVIGRIYRHLTGRTRAVSCDSSTTTPRVSTSRRLKLIGIDPISSASLTRRTFLSVSTSGRLCMAVIGRIYRRLTGRTRAVSCDWSTTTSRVSTSRRQQLIGIGSISSASPTRRTLLTVSTSGRQRLAVIGRIYRRLTRRTRAVSCD